MSNRHEQRERRDSLPTRARGSKGVRRSTPLLNDAEPEGVRGAWRSAPLLN